MGGHKLFCQQPQHLCQSCQTVTLARPTAAIPGQRGAGFAQGKREHSPPQGRAAAEAVRDEHLSQPRPVREGGRAGGQGLETEPRNHRIAGGGREVWTSSSPAPCHGRATQRRCQKNDSREGDWQSVPWGHPCPARGTERWRGRAGRAQPGRCEGSVRGRVRGSVQGRVRGGVRGSVRVV